MGGLGPKVESEVETTIYKKTITKKEKPNHTIPARYGEAERSGGHAGWIGYISLLCTFT